MKINTYLIISTFIIGMLFADIPENWEINPANFENYMTVTAVLEVNNQPSSSNSIALGAFVDDVCRGYTYPILVGEKWMYFLMVYANSNNEVIEFAAYDIDNDLIAPAYDFIVFENSVPFGSPDVPYTFYSTLNTLVLGDINFDTLLNVLDVVVLVNMILPGDEWNGGNPPSEDQLSAADVNQDGLINVLDVVTLVNLILPDDGLNRQIVWYYDEDGWTYDATRGNIASSATMIYNQNYIGIRSNGDIAGIQLTLTGDYAITNNSLPMGWDLEHKDGTVLIYSLDGSRLTSSKLFEYSGEINITKSIVADWYGSDIAVSSSTVPDQYILSNAYPNPFNPVTNFSFSLPEDAYVSIAVYNISGHLIETIINTDMYAGSHIVNWDAGNIGSGVYLLRMQAGSHKRSQKLMLIK